MERLSAEVMPHFAKTRGSLPEASLQVTGRLDQRDALGRTR